MSRAHSDHVELAAEARLAFDALWPRRQSPDDVAHWVDRFAQVLERHPLDVCWLAVDEWCDTMDRWPSPVELVAVVRRLSPTPLPEREPYGRVAGEGVARRYIDGMRRLLAVGSDLRDRHDHRQGAGGCPVCSQRDPRIVAVLDELDGRTRGQAS